MVPSYIIVILVRIFWLMVAYSATRLCFYIHNQNILEHIATKDLLLSFFYGLHFDLAAVLYSNALMILIWLAPARMQGKRWWHRLDVSLFLLINLFFMGINVMDIEYFKFTGKRTALDIFNISGDLEQHAANILLSYWKLVVLWLVMSFSVAWLCYQKEIVTSERSPLLKSVFWRVAVVVLMVIGMRGGVQLKPLHPMNAYFTTSAELGILTLNTPFNFMKSKRTFEIPETDFFSDDLEIGRRLVKLTAPSRPPLGTLQGWNVVVIIVESFATEYEKYAPFFNELKQKSFYFKYNFANGRRSIEALPSILCGIPSLMDEPIVSSDFNNNELHCLAHELGKAGYSTHFYHGAYNGSMYMDTFSKRAGFENFVGFNEFPSDRRATADDHVWGILDEPMLDYAVDQMDKAKKPFLLGVFTLSSHHPYYIPPELRSQFPDGTLEIHKSIGYTDYALKKFFERAAKSDWFGKTIFIITGDHIQKSDQPEFRSLLGQYRVPLLIYVSGKSLPFSEDHFTQHIDIQPTVFDLLGIQPEHKPLLGQSAFDNNKSYAFNFSGSSWWLVSPSYMVKLNRFSKKVEVFRQENALNMTSTDSSAARAQTSEQILDLEALVQYTLQGLVKNNIYRWEKP